MGTLRKWASARSNRKSHLGSMWRLPEARADVGRQSVMPPAPYRQHHPFTMTSMCTRTPCPLQGAQQLWPRFGSHGAVTESSQNAKAAATGPHCDRERIVERSELQSSAGLASGPPCPNTEPQRGGSLPADRNDEDACAPPPYPAMLGLPLNLPSWYLGSAQPAADRHGLPPIRIRPSQTNMHSRNWIQSPRILNCA